MAFTKMICTNNWAAIKCQGFDGLIFAGYINKTEIEKWKTCIGFCL